MDPQGGQCRAIGAPRETDDGRGPGCEREGVGVGVDPSAQFLRYRKESIKAGNCAFGPSSPPVRPKPTVVQSTSTSRSSLSTSCWRVHTRPAQKTTSVTF
ncbi:Hypothetical protein NTJ_00877 [Nesidiocoris tenuis]|uniref:Uncharacterized protein n=1 Tax=Nesidiocoris tenuis TaxID=355587 RepID=A0ABN7A731_9HEMI|nr:Hypothetical protein NTJ_00877 [Nesidiocoris tenuis]